MCCSFSTSTLYYSPETMKPLALAALLLLSRPLLAQGHPTGLAPASAALATDPLEYGAFFGGGVGLGARSDFSFTNAGVRVGKVLTDQHLSGFLRGQFEYAGELIPYWQSFTLAAGPRPVRYSSDGQTGTVLLPYGGGTFTGITITPIILRWDLKPTGRWAPYIQAAGGLLWTNHKYPPDILVPKGVPGATSVFNFTPQGGGGIHYFLRDKQAIDFQISGVHISSASLGDRNPGVNASLQFQIGYSWWK